MAPLQRVLAHAKPIHLASIAELSFLSASSVWPTGDEALWVLDWLVKGAGGLLLVPIICWNYDTLNCG